jgi:hypothetical protein
VIEIEEIAMGDFALHSIKGSPSDSSQFLLFKNFFYAGITKI